jgi:hypothetical protein
VEAGVEIGDTLMKASPQYGLRWVVPGNSRPAYFERYASGSELKLAITLHDAYGNVVNTSALLVFGSKATLRGACGHCAAQHGERHGAGVALKAGRVAGPENYREATWRTTCWC